MSMKLRIERAINAMNGKCDGPEIKGRPAFQPIKHFVKKDFVKFKWSMIKERSLLILLIL